MKTHHGKSLCRHRLHQAAVALSMLSGVAAQAADAGGDAPAPESQADSPGEMLSKGRFQGHVRTIYFHSSNAYYVPGLRQDTASIGGKIGFRSAGYQGFSFGVSGFLQRPLHRSGDPSRVDGYVGPDITAMGEAYARWENRHARVTLGNQAIELPFAASYDWRMAAQLFQGISARYGLSDGNHLTAVRMTRFKSYIDDRFRKLTTYNTTIDTYSPAGMAETPGFYGVGGVRSLDLQTMELQGQAWYFNYQDYARMAYAQAQWSTKGDGKGNGDAVLPFIAGQVFRQTGEGRKLLGKVDSKVYGLQIGAKRHSTTLSLSYNRIVPNADSYLNGALVTPYAHYVASGPMFAQPFLSSTQDLGAGNAYALDLNGAPAPGWFIGFRYSYMDLKRSATAPSLRQSEYLGYAIYQFSGSLKGLRVTNFIALARSPIHQANFWQNRLAMEYQW